MSDRRDAEQAVGWSPSGTGADRNPDRCAGQFRHSGTARSSSYGRVAPSRRRSWPKHSRAGVRAAQGPPAPWEVSVWILPAGSPNRLALRVTVRRHWETRPEKLGRKASHPLPSAQCGFGAGDRDAVFFEERPRSTVYCRASLQIGRLSGDLGGPGLRQVALVLDDQEGC